MKYHVFFFILFAMGCGTKPAPEKHFEGTFSGQSNGVTSVMQLTVQENRISGTLNLGGQTSRITGIATGAEANGDLHDQETGKDYRFKAVVSGDELRLSVTFPELNNQVLEWAMMRKGTSPGSSSDASTSRDQPARTRERDPRLLGTWRHSEVLSSNSGGSYMSLATDYFIQFEPDGTVLSWMGSSAGMGGSGGGNEDNPDRGQWFTRDNRLVFTDPVTGEEAETNYSVSENGLLLSNGSDKKIYERIN